MDKPVLIQKISGIIGELKADTASKPQPVQRKSKNPDAASKPQSVQRENKNPDTASKPQPVQKKNTAPPKPKEQREEKPLTLDSKGIPREQRPHGQNTASQQKNKGTQSGRSPKKNAAPDKSLDDAKLPEYVEENGQISYFKSNKSTIIKRRKED